MTYGYFLLIPDLFQIFHCFTFLNLNFSNFKEEVLIKQSYKVNICLYLLIINTDLIIDFIVFNLKINKNSKKNLT